VASGGKTNINKKGRSQLNSERECVCESEMGSCRLALPLSMYWFTSDRSFLQDLCLFTLFVFYEEQYTAVFESLIDSLLSSCHGGSISNLSQI